MSDLGEMEESPISDATVLAAGFCLTGCLLIVIGAFIYKVWNERQMTREYHEQAVQLKRVADVLGAKTVDQFPPTSSGPEAAFNYLHRHQLDDLLGFVALDSAEPVKRDGFKPMGSARDRIAHTDHNGYAFADCILAIPRYKTLTELDIEGCSK